jgi:hypothetical protein
MKQRDQQHPFPEGFVLLLPDVVLGLGLGTTLQIEPGSPWGRGHATGLGITGGVLHGLRATIYSGLGADDQPKLNFTVRKNPHSFNREMRVPYFSGSDTNEKNAPGKNFVKISLSYAILMGRLKFFRLTETRLIFATSL